MNRIFYATGSGNSLAIAKRIKKKIGNCECYHVNSNLDFAQPVEAEIVGFVFPVYSWGMPLLFRKFISSVKITKADYIFVMTNYAGSCGNSLGAFQKEMDKNNLTLNAFGEVKMPNNYVVMGTPDSKETAKPILVEAYKIIDEFANKIVKKQSLPMKKVSLLGRLASSLIYPAFALYAPNSDKSFFCTDKCNGCSICLKVCPADNITLNENKQPVWQHHCEQCHACFHWCPQEAIQLNKKSADKQRYNNPDIKVNELF